MSSEKGQAGSIFHSMNILLLGGWVERGTYPVLASHTRTVVSNPPEAIYVPSKATE